jgi:hypothetical protein
MISRPAASVSRRLSLSLAALLVVLIFVGSSKRRDTSKHQPLPLSNPPFTPTKVGSVPTEGAARVNLRGKSLKPVTETSIPGTTRMPTLSPSDHLLCGQYQICTAIEFKAAVRNLELTWNLMPESYRLQCTSQNTVPNMSNCITIGQMDFFSKHVGEPQDLLEQQNP